MASEVSTVAHLLESPTDPPTAAAAAAAAATGLDLPPALHIPLWLFLFPRLAAGRLPAHGTRQREEAAAILQCYNEQDQVLDAQESMITEINRTVLKSAAPDSLPSLPPQGTPFELGSNDMAEINLHAVESISDLHYASSRHDCAKGSEGSNYSPPNTPQRTHGTFSKQFSLPNEDNTSFLPPVQAVHIIPACTCCPCFSPTCCPTGFLALLGVLVVASLALATLAVYLSVLQNESLRVLARWLESQEATIRQMRAVSLQIWSRLNATEPGTQT